MLFIIRLMLTRWSILSSPVNIVVAGDRKPGHVQLFHDVAVFPHLHQPFQLTPIALNHVPDGHDQVRIQQIDFIDCLGKNPHPFSRSSGAISQNGKAEGFICRR